MPHQQQIMFGAGLAPLGAGLPVQVVKKIYVQPLATNANRMYFVTAAGGGIIKSIAAPGSGPSAIFDDFTLTAPGAGDGYVAQEHAVSGMSGDGCLVTYWPN
jgi:hypothetical protein